MELTLLGTAAAEAWPAPFCTCQSCETARQRGGRDIRTRSGALLDRDFKIDYGPDTTVQLQQQGLSLAALQTLVFTHQHQDHILPEELLWITEGFTATPLPGPVQVYGNPEVLRLMQKAPSRHFQLNLLEPLVRVTTPSGDVILPLPADHVEDALLLRISRQGFHILYGHDSGSFPVETMLALESGPPLDLVLLDCTMGGKKTGNRGHMDTDGVIALTKELRARGAVTATTRVYATHFSHNGGLCHRELEELFLPHGIGVAYDGLRLNF